MVQPSSHKCSKITSIGWSTFKRCMRKTILNLDLSISIEGLKLKQYTEKTNYRIGQIRTAIQECQSAASAKALEAEIEAIRDETKAELNRLEKEAEKARMGAIPPEWKAQGHPEDQPRRPHRRGR